ncbi:hypothetical protein [Marinococcus luteus]|uniref:hypothetical protein n=1 Tax=Marinococcus luteus TaxID=1122204 RepID=UPI002ACC6C3D|nr:hypothetical protein [Marinococcus luteus]MDZ5782096.1 hypothetical protein [Marinococcus luteus]
MNNNELFNLVQDMSSAEAHGAKGNFLEDDNDDFIRIQFKNTDGSYHSVAEFSTVASKEEVKEHLKALDLLTEENK